MFLLLFVCVGIDTATAKKDPVNCYSYVCYRRYPVVATIKQTAAWRDGRRDVLDFGCGGGGLALALAEAGAHKVVAVDLEDELVQAANKRLQSVPNAYARGPMLGAKLRGSPGLIAYRNEFDIVVSYRGALGRGTTTAKRIPAEKALHCAVDACRDGGTVVIAEFSNMKKVFLAPWMVFLFSIFAQYFIMDMAWWKLFLTSCLASWVCKKDLFLFPFAVRNIERSIQMKKWRASSIAWGTLYLPGVVFSVILPFFLDWLVVHSRKQEMKGAGLSNVKVKRQLIFRTFEALNSNKAIEAFVFRLNKRYFPRMVVTCQGDKRVPKE